MLLHFYQAIGGRFRADKPNRSAKYVPPADPLDESPYTFTPVNAAGQGVPVRKVAMTAETFAAYLAEEDAEKREAILSGCKGYGESQTSPVRPTLRKMQGYVTADGREIPGVTSLPSWSRESLAAGILVVPSSAADESAATSRKSREEREAENLAELFPEPTEEPTAETEEPTEKSAKSAKSA